MKILIIAHAPERAENFLEILDKDQAEFYVWRAFREPKPALDFDGIILTGGPMSAKELAQTHNQYFQDEIDLIKKEIDKNTPILGICLGFQLLSYLLGGKLAYKQGWLRGWFTQNLTNDGIQDLLFKGCPKSFSIFEFHQDKVVELPPNAVLLATSERCPIEAFKINNKPVWGIQFHPEISAKKAEDIFVEGRKILEKDGLDVNAQIQLGYEVYNINIAKNIFANFINQIIEKGRN